MRTFVFSLIFFATACASAPTMRSTVSKSFAEKITVDKFQTLCKMPPGTPITSNYVLLGCSTDNVPVVLDQVCQAHRTLTKACAYRLDAFKAPAKAAAAN